MSASGPLGPLVVFSCKNVKLSFLFAALYLALYAQYYEMCPKGH